MQKKNAQFQWSPDCEKAFITLKDKLVQAPILAYPTRHDTFILDTDACNEGIGAVLSQIQNGKEHVISFASRKLNKAQRSYCATHKELLAVVTFLKHYRHYLANPKFYLRTDHASLTWLMNFKEPEGMIARWISIVDTYNKEMVHRPGRKHLNADAMSRYPIRKKCKQPFCKDCTTSGQLVKKHPTRKERGYLHAIITRARAKALKEQKAKQQLNPDVDGNKQLPSTTEEVKTITTSKTSPPTKATTHVALEKPMVPIQLPVLRTIRKPSRAPQLDTIPEQPQLEDEATVADLIVPPPPGFEVESTKSSQGNSQEDFKLLNWTPVQSIEDGRTLHHTA